MNNVLQNMDNTNIYFNSLKRADWLRQIATIRNEYKKENYQKQITFVLRIHCLLNYFSLFMLLQLHV